jgi:general stress protein 26
LGGERPRIKGDLDGNRRRAKILQENHRACIAVRQSNGWLQMTFVTPGIDTEDRVIITTRGTTYKLKHLRRDPRVSLLVFGEQYSGSKFVQIHGFAEIIELPDAMASKLGRVPRAHEKRTACDHSH